VAEFLIELYVSHADSDVVERGANSARLAAEELTREGTPVRCLRSIFVPEDETCFFLFEAASAEAVREAARRAALPFERVTEVVTEAKREMTSLVRRTQPSRAQRQKPAPPDRFTVDPKEEKASLSSSLRSTSQPS
jgi:Protein of unknown function (DUF4242)